MASPKDNNVIPAQTGILDPRSGALADSLPVEDDVGIGRDDIRGFQEIVWKYYREHSRAMPWRSPTLKASADGVLNPYHIVVSEVMLQQTQVSRVLEKFPVFVAQFPSFESLAAASSAEVVIAWQGLGYNRRALNLHKLAQAVVRDHGGTLPSDPAELIKLHGIGAGTAGSIAAFAFNKPVVFIETNIRRVFIHHFFPNSMSFSGLTREPDPPIKSEDDTGVSDKDLLPLVEAALDHDNPREWYWALMDYGTALAKTVPNPNRRSRHYTKQSKFEGSARQIRGQILRSLAAGVVDRSELPDDERTDQALADLIKEGFITQTGPSYRLL